jgi:hypothetical protein
MGQETQCVVRYGDSISLGRAKLETDDLRFRGNFRLIIPLKDVHSVEAADGHLRVAFLDSEASFELGILAERWAEKIRNPRSLIDKLDVRPESRVAVLGVTDSTFLAELRQRTDYVLMHDLASNLDLIFLQAESRADLEPLADCQLEHSLRRTGTGAGIWVIAPKGRGDITEMDILSTGRACGLTDSKVARFSATHTAHKFVIPRERR